MQQPTAEEIEAQLGGRALTAVVFFLDETFEEIAWDMATTVADAVAQLAGLIKLANYETFTLFESRKVRLVLHWQAVVPTISGLCSDPTPISSTAQAAGCFGDELLLWIQTVEPIRSVTAQVPGKGEDGQPLGLVEETVLLDDHRYVCNCICSLEALGGVRLPAQ